jgi:hypothetical protein
MTSLVVFVMLLLSRGCGAKWNMGKILSLSPIKCAGKFSIGNKAMDAVFLCRKGGVEVVESDEESIEFTICDVVPVPLSIDYVPFWDQGSILDFKKSILSACIQFN